MAQSDQRLRLARGRFAGIVDGPGVGHHPAEFGSVATRARGLAGRGDALVEEQLAAEVDQRRVLDRKRRRAPIVPLQGGEIALRRLRLRRPGRREDDQAECGRDRRCCDASSHAHLTTSYVSPVSAFGFHLSTVARM
jgi:hypothetical protein